MSRVQRINQGQDILVGRDIASVVSIVGVLDDAVAIDNEHGRHPAELAQFEFLAEIGQQSFVWIRDTFEGKALLLPVFRHALRLRRADCDNLDVSGGKFRVVLTQLRQLFLADRSPESAEQREDYAFVAPIIRE